MSGNVPQARNEANEQRGRIAFALERLDLFGPARMAFDQAVAGDHVAIAGDRVGLPRQPERVRTAAARPSSTSIADHRIVEADLAAEPFEQGDHPPTSRLVPPLANHTPPSRSSLWISA